MKQVDKAIDIFEDRTKGFAQGLFIFDNAPSHQKRAADALSARYMPKFPKEGWTNKNGPRMRPTTLPDGRIQEFYFPDDHPRYPGYFKGMKVIIQERGLWPEKELLAQCEGFKCELGATTCCCRRLLFTQPDFVNQKTQLEEFVTSRGHLCDFYPKYHCELNFIEQYWGAAKLYYRNAPLTSNTADMEHKVIKSLDQVPLQQIRRWVQRLCHYKHAHSNHRYANRAARFISGYKYGLSGGEAAYATRKYHGHRTLPPEIVAEVKAHFAKTQI